MTEKRHSEEALQRLERELSGFLGSEKMRRSPALSELVLYLKARFAEKQREPTTEYAIAQDLLGKGADFDPQTDTSVRVRIRRLRQALEAYYEGQPPGPRLIIPPQSYDLEVLPPPPLAETSGQGGRRSGAWWLAGGLSVLAGALLFWLVLGPVFGWSPGWGPEWAPEWMQERAATAAPEAAREGAGAAQDRGPDRGAGAAPAEAPTGGYPLVRVLPVENLTGDAGLDLFETGLQRQFASDLQRFGRIRVVMSMPGQPDPAPADFTLRGSILSLDQQIDIAYRLEAEGDGAVLLANRIRGAILGTDYYGAISAISSQISGHVAGQGGAIGLSAPGALGPPGGEAADGGIGRDVFECIVLSDRFFADYDPAAFARAYSCFDAVQGELAGDAVAYARWGTMVFHTVPEFDLMQTGLLPERMRATPQQAYDLAARIVERFARSSDAFLLLGSVQNAMGDLSAAELSLRHAIELNPGEPTARAVLAYLFLARENFEESILSAQEAIRLSSDPQGYIYLPIALSALALGREELAVSAGRAYAGQRSGDGADAIRLITARIEGDAGEIARLSPVVAAMENPLAGFSRFAQGERLRRALQDALPEVELD